MPQFAANLSWLYQDQAFLDRIDAATLDGFQGVECMFPYGEPRVAFHERLKARGLPLVLLNAPCGDWQAGERGLACLPGREADFRDAVLTAAEWADVLGCPRVHLLAGRVPADVGQAHAWALYEERLHWALEATAGSALTWMIEPINQRDMPGYLLSRQAQAHALVARIGSPRLQVQMDLYHCQMTEGDVVAQVREHLPSGRVGHFQIAGVPARAEPDEGELPWAEAFHAIDEISRETGWSGWVGCEYRPRRGAAAGGTSAGLAWLRDWRHRSDRNAELP